MIVWSYIIKYIYDLYKTRIWKSILYLFVSRIFLLTLPKMLETAGISCIFWEHSFPTADHFCLCPRQFIIIIFTCMSILPVLSFLFLLVLVEVGCPPSTWKLIPSEKAAESFSQEEALLFLKIFLTSPFRMLYFWYAWSDFMFWL